MTDAVQMPRESTSSELVITTNRGGNRVFSCLGEVREFSVAPSEDLALLTAVLEDSNLDPAFVMQTHGLLNDLAFQLQQAVALACGTEESVSNREPARQEGHHG